MFLNAGAAFRGRLAKGDSWAADVHICPIVGGWLSGGCVPLSKGGAETWW